MGAAGEAAQACGSSEPNPQANIQQTGGRRSVRFEIFGFVCAAAPNLNASWDSINHRIVLRTGIAAPGSGAVGTEASNMSAATVGSASNSGHVRSGISPIPETRSGGISVFLRAMFHHSPAQHPVVVVLAPAACIPDKILRRIAGTAGKWKKQQAAAVLHWPRITEAELLWSDGHVERLTGLVQQHYQISQSNAERQVNRFFVLNTR